MLTILCSFSSVMNTIGRVLLAFVILMIMVLIHETGHYTAGKLLKFKINEFAVGMGPKILSKTKKNGEVVSLRLLPLGGFCAFEGENDDNPSPETFNAQKPWKRLIVLVSGALFNFISAILICVILFSAYGETVAVINKVYDYAPAQNQLLEAGDIIYKINGKKVFVLDDLSRYMDDEMSVTVLKPNGEEVTYHGLTRDSYYSVNVKSVDGSFVCNDRALSVGDFIYKIDGKSISQKGDFSKYVAEGGDTLAVTVSVGQEEYVYNISKSALESKISVSESPFKGIGMAVSYQNYNFSKNKGFGVALGRVFPYCGEVAMLVLRTLGGLITGVVGLDTIGGPISTIAVASEVVSYGFPSVLALFVLISVNLAVFNLLPVPALDGCRMIFVLIEWIAGKPINRKVENWINTIGLVLLLVFVILIDLLKL